ncbi:hypothetical protein JB92DRAFT_1555776 [Gautieria morchelliformis]|nr:hypothetical protein JB92DRAFT_1555776 [Gautieria morchelliformis]
MLCLLLFRYLMVSSSLDNLCGGFFFPYTIFYLIPFWRVFRLFKFISFFFHIRCAIVVNSRACESWFAYSFSFFI